MRPCSASRCAHIAFVELGGNGVVARYATSHDLLDDGADVGCKPACIGFQSRPAAFCNLGYVWIAKTLSPPLGGRQSVFGTPCNLLPLMLGHGSENIHCQLLGFLAIH